MIAPSTIRHPPSIPTFPARPVNGGPLDKAPAKHGLWYYEPKFNGWRALVHVPTGAMFNRKGERLSIEGQFTKALDHLKHELHRAIEGMGVDHVLTAEQVEWADCESLERRHNRGRGSLVVLDLPRLGSGPAPFPLTLRSNLLRQMFMPALDHCAASESVYSVPQYTDAMAMWFILQADNKMLGCEFYEGLVAKRADSIYPMQLRSPDVEFPFWVKHRWAF